jgi:hypothetical protein
VLGTVAVLFAGFLFYMLYAPAPESGQTPEGVVCTLDGKICLDGSSVGRVGPNCEFAACPGEEPREQSPGATICTLEAKICPDGSSVGRTGPNCAFAPCPGEELPDGTSEPSQGGIVSYFSAEMQQTAIAEVGQPIEGFDAFLLLNAYPGLVEADFDGVATREGIYAYANGELTYERRQDFPVTSAEQMISAEGYGSLLANVAERLNVEIVSEASVDAMIALLQGE